ncbi:MAG: DNA cytosine methyltransferase [Archangium sp.]|nr:DNA cytosine methyltransferase [Archangium sp.]
MKLPRKLNRRVEPVIRDLFEDSVSVTGFAGCGGADLGIVAATGRDPDIAINHDPVAIAVFADNWPSTECYRADIFSVDPVTACRGRHVRHMHASPDCRDHSRAKGGAPVSESVRALADVVPRWAEAVRPDCLTLENVEEFQDWGPLYPVNTWKRDVEITTSPACPSCSWAPDRTPDRKQKEKPPKKHRRCAWADMTSRRIPERRGEFFMEWKAKLVVLGYVVEHRVLHAHHFGAHTSRKRFYLVARCDGQPISWPAPSHGPGLKRYRTAAECIDWSLPCPSIFERKKELAAATKRRIAAGAVRYVLGKKRPYIVKVNHGDKGGKTRGAESIDAPMSTITAARRGHAVVAPTLVQTSYGEREGQAPRVLDLHKPLGTVVAGGQKHGLVETTLVPFIAGCGGRAGQSPPTAGDAPVGTITTKNDRVLVTSTLAVLRNNCDAKSVDEPAPTVCASGNHIGEVRTLLAPFIAKHYGGVVGHGVERPLGTITTVDHHSLAGITLAPEQIAEQFPNAVKVLPFLISYYGSEEDIGQAIGQPLRTVTTRDRFALVTLVVDGVTFVVVDIGMRMLEPHELLKAQFGKFAKKFKLDKALTKKDQVRLIGNSVVPVVMEAIVRANLGAHRPRPRATPGMRRAA